MRLLEAQAYRCAICTCDLDLSVFIDHSSYPTMGKLRRDYPRSYDNLVALCQTCLGRSQAFASLMAYHDAYLAGHTINVRQKPAIDEEVLEIIKGHLAARGYGHLKYPKDFGRAPKAMAISVAESIINKRKRQSNLEPWEKKAAKRRQKRLRQAKWMTDGNRRRFMEAQNHRCCYCHHGFETESPEHPRYCTWEHVEDMNFGGTSAKANVVIACRTCNNLREIENMSAFDYADWAQEHSDDIERHAKKLAGAIINRMRRKGRHLPEDHVRTKPLFEY